MAIILYPIIQSITPNAMMTKKNFMWGNSSELKSEDTEGPVSGGLHVTNKLTLNDVKLVCLERHM